MRGRLNTQSGVFQRCLAERWALWHSGIRTIRPRIAAFT